MMRPLYPSSVSFTKIQRVAFATGILSFVAGGAVGWAIALRQRPSPTVIPEDETAMIATTTSIGSVQRGIRVYEGTVERIRVTNQKAGKSVYVAAVALSQPGWVAIREEKDGTAGSILGAVWSEAGEHDITVPLLRRTQSGERYHVYLFRDDGDSTFDWREDAPITRNGLLILQSFVTY